MKTAFNGVQVLTALKQAYPQKVEEVSVRNGDLAIRVNSEWFLWAEGRLLPEELAEEGPEVIERYTPYPFYTYTQDLPPLPELSEEEKNALNNRINHREEDPPSRHPGFYNALWRVYDKDSSWARVKTTFFLGMKTEVHRELLEDLAAVEETVLKQMEVDGELRRFVKALGQLEGYNWRRIAGTASLSFHSYGTAIDVLPYSYGGKQAYWRWAKTHNPEWYSLPYEKRFTPPRSFIAAFEQHGFIWGGKWFYFDTIHFEYRPEILILNGYRPQY